MLAISFNSVLIIAVIAVLAPVLLGLLPGLPVPGAVLEVIAGVVVGPSVLNWARIDAPVEVLSDLGLGILLFLAGLEIDVDRLRSPLTRVAGIAFGCSAALALLCAVLFWLPGPETQPILLAIIFMSTSAGLLLPLLKDAGEGSTEFGQLIMTAAAVAELVPILLLSLLFSAASETPADKIVSLVVFLALLLLIGLAVFRVRRLHRLDRMLDRLERRSGQLRLRAALTLALACGLLAYRFGFASILGAFAAGLLVRIVESSRGEPNKEFLIKLDGIGFGFLVPIFFVSTGVAFQLKGLEHQPGALAEVPLFLLALLVARGVPALLYVRAIGRRRAAAGGLLQATSLTFVIVATVIGQQTGKLTPATSAALVAAGLLSAALFPAAAGRLLARGQAAGKRPGKRQKKRPGGELPLRQPRQQALGVSVGDVFPGRLGQVGPQQEVDRAVVADERVVDRVDQPLGAEHVEAEPQVRLGEHAAGGVVAVLPDVIADRALQPGGPLRQRLVQPVEEPRDHLAPVAEDDLQLRVAVEHAAQHQVQEVDPGLAVPAPGGGGEPGGDDRVKARLVVVGAGNPGGQRRMEVDRHPQPGGGAQDRVEPRGRQEVALG